MNEVDVPKLDKKKNNNSYSMDYFCSNCKRTITIWFKKGITCPVYDNETECKTCGCSMTLKLVDVH